MRRNTRTLFLPPGLHPTDPPTLSIQGWKVGRSPWGEFSWVTARVSCRSGVRARGLTMAAVVSKDAAADGLRASFGFSCRVGEVRIAAFYDAVESTWTRRFAFAVSTLSRSVSTTCSTQAP
jgi:hypothetical protein